MKPNAELVSYIVGGLVVILIPTMVTIGWNLVMRLVDALNKNTHAIIRLESRVDMISSVTQSIPKLKNDVDAAHAAIRASKDKDRILES